ncbi:MAG: hypothetical protein ACK40X_10920 [Armatimonadota bacterium]
MKKIKFVESYPLSCPEQEIYAPKPLLSAIFGCSLLLAMAAVISIGLFAVIGVQFWELLERFPLAGVSRRRWQPTNELSPPI